MISGSYLGMTAVDREYFTPIGNLQSLAVNPVSFQEYLGAIGEHGRFMGLDLLGKSLRSDYKAIHDAYESYIVIGGYPQAVSSHLEGSPVDKIKAMHEGIHALVIKECRKRIKKDVDYDIFVELCKKVPQTLLSEKRGMSLDWREVYSSDSKELDYGNVSASLYYMRGCGLLNYCYLAKGCDLRKQASLPMRLYYNDVGMAATLLGSAGQDQAAGVVAENFVYLSLNARDKRINDSILHEYPAFGTCEYERPIKPRGDSKEADGATEPKTEMVVGEIDFLHKGKASKKNWAVEVKNGSNSSKTAKYLLDSGKVDCVLYARAGEDVKGSVGTDGKIVTIPIYLIDRFDFDADYGTSRKS
jgi:predicted AAA+ superfamily ATPase